MIPAGRMQDRLGPRLVASIGGLLIGSGCVLAGLAGSSVLGFAVGFGVLAGVGIGFGYASTTPPAVKWFPPARTGMVAGIVVAGFGLASVYIAPLVSKLLIAFAVETRGLDPAGAPIVEKGVSRTMVVLGVLFLTAVVALAQLLKNPPPLERAAGGAATAGSGDRTWREMMGGLQFYLLWLMFFAGSAAGLTFISFAQDLGKRSLGELAFLAVIVLALGNAGGRIVAGIVSDRIGRQMTLLAVLLLQAGVLAVLYVARAGAGWPIILSIVLLIGANYGANLSLFPSITKDYFGLTHFGLNYGLLFTAWGCAGLIGPWVNGRIKDLTGKDDLTYPLIIGTLVAAAALTFLSRSLARRQSLA
jgi:OFA family oxalate/formate antiporter-like MFS transporter